MLDFLGPWIQAYPYTGLLLILMAFDILTGVIRAISEKKLDSTINGRGMRRKAVMLILVMVGKALERVIGDAPIAEVIAVGFCVSEGISILENATLLGAPVPPFLTQIFMQLQAASQRPFRLGDSPEDYDRILALRQAAEHAKNDALKPGVVDELLSSIEKDGLT